jgi:hypothetical protein
VLEKMLLREKDKQQRLGALLGEIGAPGGQAVLAA